VERLLNLANLTRAVVTTLLAAVVVALSLNADFYNESMVDVYMALVLGSALITLLVVQFSWKNLVSVALFSLVLAGLDYRVMGFVPKFIAAFSFIGLSSLAILGTRTIWAPKRDRVLLLWAFFPAVLFAVSEYMASTFLEFTGALHPKTFDLYLYSFDSSLRVQISFLIGQWFARHLWFRFAGLLFYIALPLPLALVYAAHLRSRNGNAFPAMLAFLATGPIGVVFYNMVPATGPIHIFGQNFPWYPLSTSQAMHLVLQTVPVTGARNAIPSLHMAWVLLIWWNSKGLSQWIRGIALAFVIFTTLATMGIGEHYFVDLVVAFPFAVMVQSLCMYHSPFQYGWRRVGFLFAALVSLGWMAMLSFTPRLFWISPIIPWAMVIVTISLSAWLMRRLQRAEFSKERNAATDVEATVLLLEHVSKTAVEYCSLASGRSDRGGS
jgi:hypothetical protein